VSRLNIEIDQPEFLPIEKQILCELLDKHEQYEGQGRDLEARAMARAATIVYRRLKGDFHDTSPTNWGSL
jgi:hypothetical protein